MAKLVLSSNGSVLNNYFIEKSRIAIGRSMESDVVIDDPRVGMEHAAIITVGEDQIIDGLDNVFGTYVNGKRITRHILQHRDVIEFGAYSLCYLNSKAAQEVELDRTMIIAALPRPANSQTVERSALAPRKVNVRFPSGSIQRRDGSIAPPITELNRVVTMVGTPGVVQAVITRRPHGYFLTHVEGARRTRLNGAPLNDSPRPLRNGDIIEAADQQFEFQLATAVAHKAIAEGTVQAAL